MEKSIKIESLDQNQNYPKSPEFEFWMVRNPSIPQPHILTADQLFSDGLLLPLHSIDNVTSSMPQPPVDDVEFVATDGPHLISAAAAVSESATGSRRWKDIFKKSESKQNLTDQKVELQKKRERRTNGGGGGGGGGEQTTSTATMLNIINIWPFSRSRSAKTNSPRPKVTTGGRKVSSAPCSRSNSGSESKVKLRGSPVRCGGVHVGRSSPVWQARRGGAASLSRLSTVDFGGRKGKNVKGCKVASNGGDIGGGNHDGSGGSHDESGVVNQFNFRNLFSSSTRKVY